MFRKAQHQWRTSGQCSVVQGLHPIFLPKQQQYVVIKTFSSFNCSVNYCQNQAKNIAPYRVPGLDHCKVSYVAAKLVKTYQNKLLIVIWRHNLRHESGPLKSIKTKVYLIGVVLWLLIPCSKMLWCNKRIPVRFNA